MSTAIFVVCKQFIIFTIYTIEFFFIKLRKMYETNVTSVFLFSQGKSEKKTENDKSMKDKILNRSVYSFKHFVDNRKLTYSP